MCVTDNYIVSPLHCRNPLLGYNSVGPLCDKPIGISSFRPLFHRFPQSNIFGATMPQLYKLWRKQIIF